MKLKTLILAAVLLAAFIAPAFSQEMPAPGTVIDKNNYKKYAHLFPEEFAPMFENGFGITPPIKMRVAKSEPSPIPKAFLEYSAKNKGKFGLDAQGYVTGGWKRDGLPFPDPQKNDKDFAMKLMWNFNARYRWDDEHDMSAGGSFQQRKGEKLSWNTADSFWPIFKGRIACSQKPDLENPTGLFSALVFHYLLPDSIKHTITLAYRYADLKKPDETYLYLPSMRRVLRAEAGQRSTPMLGSIQALDDFMGFDGNTNEFTFTLVKEQKILQVMDNKLAPKQARASVELPWPTEGYEIRDTYVIDIKAKDPKYPQGRKRIWMDKENYLINYSAAYDRAGKLWKVWSIANKKFPVVPGGAERYSIADGTTGIDIQFGMATYYAADNNINTCKFGYSDATPASLLKLAR